MALPKYSPEDEFLGINTVRRNDLVKLIDNIKARNIIESKQDIEYIKELAFEFCKELITFLGSETQKDIPRFGQKLNKIASLYDDSLRSFEGCLDYAYFLFLSNLLPLVIPMGPPIYWIMKATETYPECTFFRFLLAYSTVVISNYTNKQIKINNRVHIVLGDKMVTRDISKDIDTIKNMDSTAIISESLKKDPTTIIDAFEKRQQIGIRVLYTNENILQAHYKAFSKNISSIVTLKSYKEALTSFASAIYVRFYFIANQLDKYEEKLNEEIKLYKDNSLAVTQLAYVKMNKDPHKAEKDFKTAFSLIQTQFDGIQRLKHRIEYDIYMGLAYVYYKKGQYEEAEKKYNDALVLHLDPYLDALVLLNRGRIKLDKGDLLDALEDLSKAAKEDRLSATAHTNLALVYLKQGLYGKAESELYRSLDINPDLAHAYYNLGVLYNEEGNKGRAKKLFETAISIDKNFSEAREALRRLQGSELKNIGGDWHDWWFGKNASKLKKGLGIAIVILTAIIIAKANINLYFNWEISNSLFAVLAINILIILLPILSKLKMGPVELEVQSKGERPVLIDTFSAGFTASDTTSVSGIHFALFDFVLY